MKEPATALGGDGSDVADAASGSSVDVLRELVGEAEQVSAAVSLAQVAEVRMLARAGQLAELDAAGASANVRSHDMALRSIAAELGGVLRITDRTVQARIGEARELVECFPTTLAAWEDGRITRGHVRVIVDTGRIVPIEVRERFELSAIDRCLSETPNRVRAALELMAERLADRTLTERHEEAARGRGVRLVPGRDGMCDIVATVPTVIGDGILDRLTRQAQVIVDSRAPEGSDAFGVGGPVLTDPAAAFSFDGAVPGTAGDFTTGGAGGGETVGDGTSALATDRRTVDQVRADVFADLLLAGTPALDPTAHGDGEGALGAIRAQVQVVVSALSIIGHDDTPADLIGRSPIDADTARTLAKNAPSLTRMLTDPADGTVLAVDSYRPVWAQRRHLRARDQHCRWPGCRMAAIRCELDHTVDAVLGGPTALTNLAHLCQRHHSMKQFTPWTVKRKTHGHLKWTSPTGRIYREDAPVSPVAFIPYRVPDPGPDWIFDAAHPDDPPDPGALAGIPSDTGDFGDLCDRSGPGIPLEADRQITALDPAPF
ncbi:HNH endonuclease signature motif containing protein [Schumannella sp. 10F1B-5-1]|uniref:HNH endonuclease signature motif containing protein n=1 Tax=Schumannella sp. 10F1B-5-1 TaxID=2590780 RepID=UPI001130D2DE|nr:HNH endonuclease signature motif containing protein [Schumannella sp. 10F1B-5-1]TPW72290.1 DUF222 domain-containing protein [Schumannella sp. 10F1B-5-1]